MPPQHQAVPSNVLGSLVRMLHVVQHLLHQGKGVSLPCLPAINPSPCLGAQGETGAWLEERLREEDLWHRLEKGELELRPGLAQGRGLRARIRWICSRAGRGRRRRNGAWWSCGMALRACQPIALGLAAAAGAGCPSWSLGLGFPAVKVRSCLSAQSTEASSISRQRAGVPALRSILGCPFLLQQSRLCGSSMSSLLMDPACLPCGI